MLDNERDIIHQAQHGDAEAFGLLYDHYLSPIYRFVYLKVSNVAETQDITHEVFLKAWKNIDQFSDQGHPFSSWLYQIARHHVIDFYRTRKHNLALEVVGEEKVPVVEMMEQHIDARLDMSRVKQALHRLNDDQQNVVIMRFMEGLSYPEIAEALNKTEGAIRIIQHRAINNLKQIVNEKTNEHLA